MINTASWRNKNKKFIKKQLYISLLNLKIIQEDDDLQNTNIYEVKKGEQVFFIKTKRIVLSKVERLNYWIDPKFENETVINLNDEDNGLSIRNSRTKKVIKAQSINKANNSISNLKQEIKQLFNEELINANNNLKQELQELLNEKIQNLNESLIEIFFKKGKFKRQEKWNYYLKASGYLPIKIWLNPRKIISQPENPIDGNEYTWQIRTKYKSIYRTIVVTTKFPISKLQYLHFYISESEERLVVWNISDSKNQISFGNQIE